MRTRPLTSARALGPVSVAESRPRRPFVLDARALARAGASRVLALAPEAIGALHTLAASAPAKPKADARGVAEVRVFGPLSQRGSEYDCGFGDGYDAIEQRIAEAAADADTRAMVVRIDSPGGDVAGLEQAVGRMRTAIARSGKPCAVYVDELAASAAYWIASALSTAGIVVPESGGVGSIGCIAAIVDETGALAKEGIAVELVRDPPGKAASHSYGPLTDLARERVAAEVGEAAARFTAAVAQARGLDEAAVRALDGDVLRGSKAVAAGLADKVGSFGDAVALVLGATAPAARAAARSAATTTTARTPRPKTSPRMRAALAGETMDPKALIDALAACSQACTAHAQKCDQTAEIAQNGSPEEIAAAAGECLQSAAECDKAVDACMMACAEASGQPMPMDEDEEAYKALLAATGRRTLGEALGALEAMKGQATQLRQLAGEVAQMKAARERETATKLLDDAQRGRKFGGGETAVAARAKAEGLFTRFGLAALEAHVDALVPVAGPVAAPVQEPKAEGRAADSSKPGAAVAKPYEKLTPGEKHALRSADPDTYEALRADWVSRGKPASAA